MAKLRTPDLFCLDRRVSAKRYCPEMGAGVLVWVGLWLWGFLELMSYPLPTTGAPAELARARTFASSWRPKIALGAWFVSSAVLFVRCVLICAG